MNKLTIYVPGENNFIFKFLPVATYDKVNVDKELSISRNILVNRIKSRMEYARQEGCTTLAIAGRAEPLLNLPYIELITNVNRSLSSPFENIELQTNGSELAKDDTLAFEFLKQTDIKSIVLYIMAFDDYKHIQMVSNGTLTPEKIPLDYLTEEIKNQGYNIYLNMAATKWIEFNLPTDDIIPQVQHLHANRITIREMFETGNPHQDNWIMQNGCQADTLKRIATALENESIIGHTIEGYPIYDMQDIGFCLVSQYQKKIETNDKHFYIYPDGRLYWQNNSIASLIF